LPLRTNSIRIKVDADRSHSRQQKVPSFPFGGRQFLSGFFHSNSPFAAIQLKNEATARKSADKNIVVLRTRNMVQIPKKSGRAHSVAEGISLVGILGYWSSPMSREGPLRYRQQKPVDIAVQPTAGLPTEASTRLLLHSSPLPHFDGTRLTKFSAVSKPSRSGGAVWRKLRLDQETGCCLFASLRTVLPVWTRLR